MHKIEIAHNLVKLHSDYQELISKYGHTIDTKYCEAVAQAILWLSQEEKRGAE